MKTSRKTILMYAYFFKFIRCAFFQEFFFFAGSQELHVAAPISANPAFNKFNSLDRRALNKRQTGNNGLLKLATPTSASGSESLPVRPLINQFNKEPERRHSSYDPTGNNKSRVGRSGKGKFYSKLG